MPVNELFHKDGLLRMLPIRSANLTTPILQELHSWCLKIKQATLAEDCFLLLSLRSYVYQRWQSVSFGGVIYDEAASNGGCPYVVRGPGGIVTKIRFVKLSKLCRSS